MTLETLRALNERSLEVIEQVTSDVSATVRLNEAQTVPMADGSGRWVTLLTFYVQEGDEEIQYRVCSPAPDNAPLWASGYTDYVVEQLGAFPSPTNDLASLPTNDLASLLAPYRPGRAPVIGVGTRVSYEDMANPRREGSIVGEVSGQWAVVWDAEYAAAFGLTTATVPVPKGGDVVLVEFHTTVTKQMLERAAERQEIAERRVAGWNVVLDDALAYDVGGIIEYRANGGGLRRVRVIYRSDDFKDGRAGFDGELLNMTDEPTGTTVWGYDEQIVRVEGAQDGS